MWVGSADLESDSGSLLSNMETTLVEPQQIWTRTADHVHSQPATHRPQQTHKSDFDPKTCLYSRNTDLQETEVQNKTHVKTS